MSELRKYSVHLEFDVLAEELADAFSIGTGAAEHLLETFNDNDSLQHPINVRVERRPAKERQ